MRVKEAKSLQEEERVQVIVKKGKNHKPSGPWVITEEVSLGRKFEEFSKEPMISVSIKKKDGTLKKKKKRKAVRFRPLRPWEFAGFEDNLTAIKWEALKRVEQRKREREAFLKEQEFKRIARERKRHERVLVMERTLRRKMEPFRFLEEGGAWVPPVKVLEAPGKEKKKIRWKKKKRCSLWLKPKVRSFNPTRRSIVINTPLFSRWVNRQVKGRPSNSIIKVAWGHYPIVVPFVQLWRIWKRKAVKLNVRKPPVIFRGPKDLFFKPFNPIWRPMTAWEKWRARERWGSRVSAIALAVRGRAADLAAADDFPQRITAKRRLHLVARIFNHLLPALAKGFGWKNYPAKFHRVCPPHLWLKQAWKTYPCGYYRWFIRQLTDYHLQRYHWKLRMTLTVSTKYYKKAKARERNVEKVRARNMEKWLALVRDDPRKRFLDIAEANYSYSNAWSSWAAEPESQKLVRLFRPEAFMSD